MCMSGYGLVTVGSPLPLRLVAWALLVVFNKLFNRIHVSRRHVSMLLRAQEVRATSSKRQ